VKTEIHVTISYKKIYRENVFDLHEKTFLSAKVLYIESISVNFF